MAKPMFDLCDRWVPSHQSYHVDAGMAILISDSVHLIEFPSLLLPPGITTGSIVNISCTRNHAAEDERTSQFWALQKSILSEYGQRTPVPPQLRLRNVTQTSVTLEWDRLDLASAKLLNLTIYRNGQRLTNIPNPLNNTSTKLSGLDLDTDYTFHLVLKTTAGTFSSPVIKVRTHTISDTSGISVCFGHIQPPHLVDEAKEALAAMNARWSDRIQIDTTHFVCTTPAASPSQPGPGVDYQRAQQLSIPIVQPSWVMACRREKKMVPISGHYLGVSPPTAGSVPLTGPGSRAPERRRTAEVVPSQADQAGESANDPTPASDPSSETPPPVVVTASAPPPEKADQVIKPAAPPTEESVTVTDGEQAGDVHPAKEEDEDDLEDVQLDSAAAP